MQGLVIVVLVAGGIALPVAFAGLVYTLFYGRKPQWWVPAAILWLLLLLIVAVSNLGWWWNSDLDVVGGKDRLDELVAEGETVLEATAAAVPELGATEVSVLIDHCFMRGGYYGHLALQGQDGSAAYLKDVDDSWQEMFGITPEHQFQNPRLTVTVGSATYRAYTYRSGDSLSVFTTTPGCIALEGQGAWTVWPIMLWATILAAWVKMLRVWPLRDGPRWRNRPPEQEA